MQIIIPQNEDNDKIVFDFRDSIDMGYEESWGQYIQDCIYLYEQINQKMSSTEKISFINKLCSKEFSSDMINNYILILKKECVDHRFMDMSNEEIYTVFSQNLILVKRLDVFMNTSKLDQNIDKGLREKFVKFYRAIRRNPRYSVHLLPPNEPVEISVPIWNSLTQTISYREACGTTPLGEMDMIITPTFKSIDFNAGSLAAHKEITM